ncbi:TPA: hypothetical protein ACRRWQ_000787 [Morganella morganii]
MKKNKLSVGVTGFIDILGFSEKVKNAKTEGDVKKICHDVKKIQDEFDFKTSDELTAAVQKINKTTVLAFSDCVVINIPLKSQSTKYSGTFDPIMSELANFAYAQGNCVQSSLFIRGGIELGWWYHDGDTLISQSMVGAVRREESACVPVIALCDELYKYFSEHEDRRFYSSEIEPVNNVFRRYSKGGVEFFYIDYITICIEALDWIQSPSQLADYKKATADEKEKIMSSGYNLAVHRWLSRHARNIEKGARLAQSEKVREKYIWLADYHNDIAKKYNVSDICICKI